MSYIIARENGRAIPTEDKIFALSGRAKAMIAKEGRDAVINATIGTLLADDGSTVIMSSVIEASKTLKPTDYAEYAPIGGLPAYKEAIQKSLFRDYTPKSFIEVVASPGGTGALRNAVSNYSSPGEKVLTSDWFWGPYKTIVSEQGRNLATFELFDDELNFNAKSFGENVRKLCASQEGLLIFLNTPAHNPTGYSLTDEDWDEVIAIIKDASGGGKRIVLLVDAAYIDFAGDSKKYRKFLPKLDTLPENVLPLIAYSLSKTFTMYGMRTGALVCMAKTEEIAQEFKTVCEYSSRGTWSNCVKAGQVLTANIYADPNLLAKVSEERREFREMLGRRGAAFSEAVIDAGLEHVPYDSGFFSCIPCEDPAAVSANLEKQGVFVVPLAKGLRASVASISEDLCKKLPAIIASEILK